MEAISRRGFVCGGAVAVLALRSGWALPASVPIGVQLYSVGDDLKRDPLGTLRRLKAIGYARVETAGFGGVTAEQFRGYLRQTGLVCRSIHMQGGAAAVDAQFAAAHTLGAHFVVSSGSFPGGHDGAPTVADYHGLADRLNDLGRRAKQAGLQYAYHNHNFEFRRLENGGVGYDVLLERTDPALVSFEMDCGWVVAAGYQPEVYFRRYPGRYHMLHIKDFVATSRPSTSLAKGERPQGTELGHGHIDYRPILRAAKKAGIHDYYVEQEPPFPDMSPLDAMKVDYEYLRAL